MQTTLLTYYYIQRPASSLPATPDGSAADEEEGRR
jgi:hypothetical protein